MKKSTIFKILMSLCLSLFVITMFGQYTATGPSSDKWEDFSANNEGVGDKYTIDGNETPSYITINMALPIHVNPDPAFLSANYDFETNATTGLTSTWTWVSDNATDFSSPPDAAITILLGGTDGIVGPAAAAGVGRTIVYSAIDPFDDNFITVEYSTKGMHYLRARETSDAAYGTCGGTYSTLA